MNSIEQYNSLREANLHDYNSGSHLFKQKHLKLISLYSQLPELDKELLEEKHIDYLSKVINLNPLGSLKTPKSLDERILSIAKNVNK